MSNVKKHNVLKQLSIYFDSKSQEAIPYTVYGKSMSIEQLHEKTKYSISEIKIICKTLQHAKLICPTAKEDESNIQRYYINDLGKISLFEEYFLSSLWYKDWKFLIPLLISILAFLVPTLLSKDDTTIKDRISTLESQVIELKKELKLSKSK